MGRIRYQPPRLPMLTLLVSLLLTAAPRALKDELRLAADGKAAFTIAVAGSAAVNADDPERHAAEELARFLEEISGARFDLKPLAEAGPGPKILVGADAAASVVRADEIAALGKEGYIIRASGGDLAIAGGRPRGTLYGVYSFLEDRLGCRWFTPDVSRIPKNAAPSVARDEMRRVPRLEYRSTDYPNSRDADWAVRNKLNGTQTLLDARRGGKVEYRHFVHTFNEILDPAKHFQAHPEYFSEVDGKRIGGQTQLCLTNPEVLELATRTVRGWMREAPAATIFSVSQNDWFNPCACAACKAVYAAEGEAWSGPLLHFVDAIAAATKEEFPDNAIDTLAYQYTRKPPASVKPLPNVIVRLCSIECCFAHPLDSPAGLDAANAAFAADIERWSKLCDRLYVWDYVIDYSHSIMPFPNLRSLAPNIRFFVAHGVKGVYEEADYFTRGGELADLRTWILAKTMWDPDYDTQRAIDEFLAGYYGDAAAPIGEYIRLVHDRASAEKVHFTIWAGPDSPLFSAELLEGAEKLFDAAEAKVAAQPALLQRVQIARLPVTYVRIEQLARSLGPAPPAEQKRLLARLLARFEAGASQEGVAMVNEWRSYDDWRAAMRALCD